MRSVVRYLPACVLPELPADIAGKTAKAYKDVYRRLTGKVLS